MTELISPFDTTPLEAPQASYFSLARRITSRGGTPSSPRTPATPDTPSDERTKMMKNFSLDGLQSRKSRFKLTMRSRRSRIPIEDKYTTPNELLDPNASQDQLPLSRVRQFSATSSMTVQSETQEGERGRSRFGSVASNLSDTGTLYEMNAIPKKEFVRKLSLSPAPDRERFASISSVSSDTPTLYDKDFVYDKLQKRPSLSAGSEAPALSRKASLIPTTNTIQEEDPTAVEPLPPLPYDYAKQHTEIELLPSGNAESSIEETTEEDLDDEEPPYVPPAFEVIDPAIPVVEPEPAMTTTEVPQVSHPWAIPPFNVVEREKPTIHKFRATVKISLSLAVVMSLLVGYGLRVKIVHFGRFSFGMYGLLLVIDFIIQTIAASVNRRRVVKLTKQSRMTKGVQQLKDKAEGKELAEGEEEIKLPEVSIAVVGYREDEEAWQGCLKSLQAQEFPIKHIIGVVDGNDPPDLEMANAFGRAFPEDQRLIVHLPVLLSVMYKEKYWETLKVLGYEAPTRWQYFKMWFTQDARPGQEVAHEIAWSHVLDYLYTRSSLERWSDYKGICFSQPHGHKRHAMFTSFMVGAYALGTKDAMLTTDSDTYVYPNAVTNLMSLLMSHPKMAGVTGDVRIWNKKDSFLALMSSLRYWFAFNVERACQSAFGCVGCLSGPLGLYKTSDLMSVLGPWILQSFLGKETTFGDDRHLSNRILSLGHKTGYTHLAMCDSDTPAGYVRWVKQQTRWSKSFFREAFWFPKSFAYHDAWLTVETTKQFLYPMILTATVIQMFYRPSYWTRPVIWLSTMFGVAVIKSVYGVVCMRDPMHFLFGVYGFMYFFGLLPSKLFACFTVGITTWGTSARSKSEFARPESIYSRTTHVGHLVTWYLALSFGLGYFMSTAFHLPVLWALGGIGFFPVLHLYHDCITGEAKYYYFVYRKWRRTRKAAKANVDVEQANTIRHVVSATESQGPSVTESSGPSTVEIAGTEVPAIRIFSADIPDPFEPESLYPSSAAVPELNNPFVPSGPLPSTVSDSASSSLDHRPSEVTLLDNPDEPRRGSEATLLEEQPRSLEIKSPMPRRQSVTIAEDGYREDVAKPGDTILYHTIPLATPSISAYPSPNPSLSDLALPTLKKTKSVGRTIPQLKKGWIKRDASNNEKTTAREEEPPLPVGVAV